MGNRRYSITASDKKMVPIIAMFNKTEGPKSKTYLALMACNDCKTEVIANNMEKPNCPCCAGRMEASSERLMEHSRADIKNMETIGVCEACDTQMVQPLTASSEYDSNKLYCPVCTTVVTASTKSSEDDEEDEDEELNEDEGDDTVDEEDEGLFDSDKGDGEEVENTDSEDTTSEDTTSEDTNSEGTSADSTDDSTTEDSADSEENSTDDATSEDTNSDDTANTDDTGSGKSLNADLVQAMAGKEGAVSVVPSPDRSKWYLFLDNVPVAVSDKSNATEAVQKMFDNDKFVTAWEAATTDGVTEDALASFGFTSIKTEVPVEEAVAQNLEASIREEQNKYEIKAKDYGDRFTRCLGIAAVGVTKKVFKESNPVATALIASLKGARIRNPETMVNGAFNKHGESYLRSIVLRATELMEKSDETLDELANTVADSAQQEPEVEVEDKAEKQESNKIIPLNLKVEEKRADQDVEKKEEELVASDTDSLSKIDRLFSRVAH